MDPSCSTAFVELHLFRSGKVSEVGGLNVQGLLVVGVSGRIVLRRGG